MAMTTRIEPELQPVRIKDLHPTQMTVGIREVGIKQSAWRLTAANQGPEFLGKHMIPAVLGPKHRLWLIDHHHLARALYDEGVEHVLVTIVARLQHLDKDRFMAFLDCHNWLHPYDAAGKRQSWRDIPKHVGDLADDPYRSLAGAVRQNCGYAKTATPYSEFLWADFFRRRISARQIDRKFASAVDKATLLARSHDAAYLPGFAGKEDGIPHGIEDAD
jgi:hypothetical protein